MPTTRFPKPLQGLALFVAWLALIMVAATRAHLVEAMAGGYTGCHGCFTVPTLGQDAWLVAFASLLALVACLARGAIVRVAAAVLLVLTVAVTALDLAVFDLLSQRLLLDDVLKLGGDVGANWSVVTASVAGTAGRVKAAVAIALILVLVLACLPSPRRPRLALVFGAGALVAGVFALHARTLPVRYVHAWLTGNVVEANLPQGRLRAYGDAHMARQRARLEALPQICERNAHPRRPNVVIVLAESLSAWHSGLLGGPADWTPRLDAIARDNHYFTRFYANGFTTSGGEIAIGTAQVPFTPPGVRDARFDHYVLDTGTLPDLARRSGHQSAFLTPGDTSFIGIGDWLKRLGFDVVDGADDAFYEGHRRWQFGAAEDRVFYDRFLSWLDTRDATQPFVAILLTVTSHPPFVDPRSGAIDPESTMRYVDAEIGRLYDTLKARGFLDDGVMLVLGDHRTMTPLAAFEYASHGERAFARVPLVVAGAVDMPKVVEAPFQQADIVPSLAWLFGETRCRDAFAGSFLRADPQPPRHVVHVRGDDRDRVDVYHGDGEVAGYRLDGDSSTWIGTPPPDAEDAAAWIDVHRDDAMKRLQAMPPKP
ncbi:LTA synthase family protein [Dokdonella sp. MW10]|uniref:LTA synthase family protein n=1 Tax=Dokdonella sp. MW10 TaxID=2992926 RepID=UPI003F7F98B2